MRDESCHREDTLDYVICRKERDALIPLRRASHAPFLSLRLEHDFEGELTDNESDMRPIRPRPRHYG